MLQISAQTWNVGGSGVIAAETIAAGTAIKNVTEIVPSWSTRLRVHFEAGGAAGATRRLGGRQ